MGIPIDLKYKRIIVCLNIGDDECSASLYQKSEYGYSNSRLNFEISDDLKWMCIPTALCYNENGDTFIGKMTLDESYTNVTNFIKPPPIVGGKDGWSTPCPATGGKLSFYDCMHLFIKTLWENLIRCNPDEFKASGSEMPYSINPLWSMAILASLPESYGWQGASSKEEYEELIRRATGVNCVFSVSRSVAAASGAAKNNESFKYNDGVLVFNFGYGSADFGYCYGNIRKRLSYNLGLNLIDKAIFRSINEDAGFDLEDDGFPYKDARIALEFSLRLGVREKYFSSFLSTGESFVFKSEELKREFVIDDAFIDRALNSRVRVPIKENGEGRKNINGEGWLELCRNYMLRCKNSLGTSHPIDRIVLIGSGANMYFLDKMCYEVFGIKPERDISQPDYVCDGLAQIAYNVSSADAIITEEMKCLLDADNSRINSEISEAYRSVEKYLKRKTEQYVENKDDPTEAVKYGALAEEANRYIGDLINREKKDLLSLIDKPIKSIEKVISKRYSEIEARCSKTLYGRENFGSRTEFELYNETQFKRFMDHDFSDYELFTLFGGIGCYLNKNEKFTRMLHPLTPDDRYPILPERLVSGNYQYGVSYIMELMDVNRRTVLSRIFADTARIIGNISNLREFMTEEQIIVEVGKIHDELKRSEEDDEYDGNDILDRPIYNM